MDNYKVVVGRKWNNPKIEAYASSDGITLTMTLEDFVTSLVAETELPLFRTEKRVKERIHQAATRVLAEIKTASREVI